MFDKKFFQNEYTAGLLLIIAAVIALILNNSQFGWIYDGFLSIPMAIQISDLVIKKPLLLWINDGLMAIFFFLIGLEIKREMIEGELSSIKKASLPVIAALGGVTFPALIYLYFNHTDPVAIHGWGIPVATDIAFALGVLSLAGKSIPVNLKIILLTLAISDDLFAILIIAMFYTEKLSLLALFLATLGFAVAIAFNIFGARRKAPYILVGIFMWVCVLKSGVHATIAGVLLAFTIPMKTKHDDRSPLKELEHMLRPWACFIVMPIFAFANAGVSLAGLSLAKLSTSLPLGIMTGLFIGKQLGVFSFILIAVKTGLCQLPAHVRWIHIYGLALLCGIGFTMSLFIGTLAFDSVELQAQVRLAVLIGSSASALCGYLVLRLSTRR